MLEEHANNSTEHGWGRHMDQKSAAGFSARQAWRACLVVACVLHSVAAMAEDKSLPPNGVTVFTFIDSAVMLKPGETAGGGALDFHLAAGSQEQAPIVTEFGPEPVVVEKGQLSPIGDPKAGDWRIAITVKGLEPNTSVTRHLRVTVNNISQTQNYTISNTHAAFSWDVHSLGGNLVWSEKQPIVAMVTVGPVAATHLTVNAILNDETTFAQFANADLQVCRNREGDCGRLDTLKANRPYRLFLRPPPGITPSPGKYVGSIEMVASEGKSSASNVTVYVSGFCYRLVGIFAIVVGVLLSCLFTVGIRNQLARKQLLLPAARLRDAFYELRMRLPRLKFTDSGKIVTERIAYWEKRLSADKLIDASLVPAWYSLDVPTAVISPAYQQLLDKAAAWTIAIAQIIDGGLAPIAGRLENLDDAKRKTLEIAVRPAWIAIDALAIDPALDPDPAPPQTDVLKNNIVAQLAIANAALGDMAAAMPTVPEIASQQLRFQIGILSMANLLVAALLTVLVGSYFLVISHPDFGRINDICLCFFWGLGLPTVGTQLSQMTPSTIAGSLGINLVKPGG